MPTRAYLIKVLSISFLFGYGFPTESWSYESETPMRSQSEESVEGAETGPEWSAKPDHFELVDTQSAPGIDALVDCKPFC